jgi:hypothetical protein
MTRLIVTMIACVALANVAYAQWAPQKAPIMTRWAKDVSPEKAWPEYPRPQMQRSDWQNLNGLWDYAITLKDAEQPREWQGKILVPFPVESALSGVMKMVGKDNRLWYHRTFTVPTTPAWSDKKIMLNFGAVDWDSTIYINGKQVDHHVGGYDPFSVDVRDALKAGENEIVVSVWDPTTAGYQPIGKQTAKPGGIFYTPTTGIWQTVWLEPVDLHGITDIQVHPNLDEGTVTVDAQTGPPSKLIIDVNVEVLDGDNVIAKGRAGQAIKIPSPKPWSPDAPFLYGLRLNVTTDSPTNRDTVTSYFGLRKIALAKDDNGINRLMLNNKFVFQIGFLDQGFWPDGLYTAPTDEALRFDIEQTKKFGMNLARKHVKVEPDRWYYWCDKLGLLVWQDMPSGDMSSGRRNADGQRKPESAANYDRELKALIDTHRNHPSIVMWVPFNEGWGQFDTARVTNWIKQYDPSRLVDCASGWTDFPVGDVHDMHSYPGPNAPKNEEKRAAVLGEFGGLGLPLEGHTWQEKGNWGYRKMGDRETLAASYENLIERLRPLIAGGLCAAVYTQTTDVEVECNGLMTYDREITKIPAERLAAAHRKLFLPLPKLVTLIPTSQETGLDWQYATEKPADNWFAPNFDATKWKTAPAGFGTKGTPGAIVRTEWKTSDIYIRRTFDLKQAASNPQLMIHHDDDAEVYVNGQLIASLTGYQGDYAPASAAKLKTALKPGQNTIAIHCHQNAGGQYIDAGIVDVVEVETGK